MKAQDKTERILRSLHILLSRSETYPGQPSRVVVNREQMVGLLNELTSCIYDMMNEYEMTTESRNMAEREFQKHGDQIVIKANHRAEDVYAASVMYTDEALNSIQDIMEDTAQTLQVLYDDMQHRMKEEKQRLRNNQLELRSQLQDLADTDKYLKIIEDRNRELEKEKKEQEHAAYAASEKNIYADRSTGIKINKAYFEMMGIPLEEDVPQDQALEDEAADLGIVLDTPGALPPDPELAKRAAETQIRVDADAEYFRWKEQQEAQNSASVSGDESAVFGDSYSGGQEDGAEGDYPEEAAFGDSYSAAEAEPEEAAFGDSYSAAEAEPEEAVFGDSYGPENFDTVQQEEVAAAYPEDYAQGQQEEAAAYAGGYDQAQDLEQPVGAEQPQAYEPEQPQSYESVYGAETDYAAQGYEQEPEPGYDQQFVSPEEDIGPTPEEVAAAGMAQQELIDKAAREAEEELSAGIHAIWQSMSESMKKDEEENPSEERNKADV